MPKFTVRNLNRFLALKLPSAYISGIRVTHISDQEASAKVRHRWINQNPFRSLYWATQGMAAELVTGILMMKKINDSGRKISMLVVHQEGSFHKKATGKIIFKCEQGTEVDKALNKAIDTGEGQSLILKASGINEDNVVVSDFSFTWSIKLKE
ncbi:DUF4442 domain-containing protein [Lutimonas zeaxanthinifaciens]|uniref:DUF4442 domain-containing protein n=1 Tax=Lutimonas zeaxanthinifaciens TaxID=3060215 RepID=UPI00265D5DD2|nr:DUF4442 domain-containing protein [Lutimonas sp. YSD2104]WKK66961.1 DUF4442 domain-containing protein [Lutimonas sp. YSD2104]